MWIAVIVLAGVIVVHLVPGTAAVHHSIRPIR
jgi:hypothetical protein